MRYGTMRRRARGFTLIEVLGALAVAAIMLIGIAAMMDASVNDVRAQQAAKYQEQVTSAAARVLKRDYDDWKKKAATSQLVVMTLASLQKSGDLPPGMQALNPYGQSTCVLIKLVANGPGLDALVVTNGGEAIRDVDLGPIAAGSGAGGGSVAASNPAEARGAYGNWIVNLAAYMSGAVLPDCGRPGPGHLANEIFFNGPGQQVNNEYLYRGKIDGHPEVNRMTTPIWLSVTAKPDQADTENCGTVREGFTNGKIAADGNGNLASCRNGYWRGAGGYWKDPVQNADALPNGPNNERGDVRLTLDTYRAYSWTGSAWQALAIDRDGNLIVPGVVSATRMAITGTSVIRSSCQSDSGGKSAGQMSMSTDGRLLTCENGKWVPQARIEIGRTDKDCRIIMETPGATDFTCPVAYTGGYKPPYVSKAPDGTYTYVIERTVTLDNNGVISVSAYMHMAYALCNQTGRVGQMRLIVQIVDQRNGNVIATNEAQSSKLNDDASTINVTLNQAADPGQGYIVRLSSNWATYDRDRPDGWISTYCAGNNSYPFVQTSLATGWTINSFY